MIRNFTKLAMFTILAGSAYGQKQNVGGPASNNPKSEINDLKDIVNMPSFDLDAVLEANAANELNKIGPYMFGYEHQVNYDLTNSGEWITLLNGDRIWRITVKSEDALSLNFVFNDFYMPEGAHVHIYNEDKSMVDGAYTFDNNNENNQLGTNLVKGEVATVEYFEPSENYGQGRLMISMIVHGYRDINNWYSEKVNESGGCNMDVVCPDGGDWEAEIRSVARILNGGGLCTGTLINDVPQSGTPYFLTANHCGPQSMGSAVFRFNFDSPICGSQTSANSQNGTSNQQVNGSSLKSRKADSDFGLVELNTSPPASYGVYYAGWDNSGSVPTTAVGIHHPSGDVKKISFDDDGLQSAAGLSSVANSEWRIEEWERLTTTEGGSSGSGLWDQNHRIVGQLHGGQAACGNSVNDYYGKFDYSWDGNGSNSSSERLRDWLDPQNTGATTVDGWDPNQPAVAEDAGLQAPGASIETLCSSEFTPEVTIKNSGQNTLTSATITYSLDGGTSQTYNWSGSLATNASEIVTLPTMAVSGAGSHTFDASVSNPNGVNDGNANNDDYSVTFNAVPNSQPMFLELLIDCYGEEVSWEITEQGSSSVLFSGSDYPGTGQAPQAGGTQVTEEFCLSNGCYTFTISDDYGDGMAGAQYNSCDTDGNYDIVDYYQNNFVTMGADPDYGNSTSHDFCITSVGVNENDLNTQIGVYPNPTSGDLNIINGGDNLAVISIEINDLRGALVLSSNINSIAKQSSVDLGDLSQGVYLAKINTSKGIVVKKITKK